MDDISAPGVAPPVARLAGAADPKTQAPDRPPLAVVPPDVIRRARALPVVRDLFVTGAGYFPAARRHHVSRPEGHGEAILLYCVHGAGWCRLKDQEWRLKEGWALFVPPGTPHVYAAEDANPWAVWWVHFGGERAAAYLEALRVSPDEPLVYVPDRQVTVAAFEELHAHLRYGFSDAALLGLSTALARLLGLLAIHQRSPHARGRKGEEKILHSIRLMEQRLGEACRLGDLARAVGLSAPHYSALFRKLTGTSPARFFTGLKVKRACELLDATDQPVAEIARCVGYDDPLHFSRVFKRVTGKSPTQFRSAIKG